MITLKTDKYGDLVPPLSESEYKALKASIKEHGLKQLIDVDERGNIFDGHHRYKAIQELKKEGITVPASTKQHRIKSDQDGRTFALMVNVVRRSLSLAARKKMIEDELKRNPNASNRKIAKIFNVDHKTVGTKRQNLESTGEIPQLNERTGDDGRTRTVAEPRASAQQHEITKEQIAAINDEIDRELVEPPPDVLTWKDGRARTDHGEYLIYSKGHNIGSVTSKRRFPKAFTV
jgi:hypothetical protein